MNWGEVKARIVEEHNQTELLMCVTLQPPQFVEPPTEQQADQGSVLALKDVDGVSPTTTSSEDDVAELKTQPPQGVASGKDGEVSEADEAENGVGTVVAVEAVEVCEAGLQLRENEPDEAHWVPPPPEGQVSMAIELCVVGVKTCFSIVCDRGEIQLFFVLSKLRIKTYIFEFLVVLSPCCARMIARRTTLQNIASLRGWPGWPEKG